CPLRAQVAPAASDTPSSGEREGSAPDASSIPARSPLDFGDKICPLRPADAPLALIKRILASGSVFLVSAKGAGQSYTQFLVDEYTASRHNAGLSTSSAANHGSTSCAGISLRCMSTWTTQELRKRGIGKRKQARRGAGGTLPRVHRGIYTTGRASAHNIARARTQSLAAVPLAGPSPTQLHFGHTLPF